MARTRYRVLDTDHAYFMTDTVVAWLPAFAQPALVEVVIDSWRYLRAQSGLKLYGYVILENHLHWIASASTLATDVARFKSYTARRCIDELGQRGFSTMLAELCHFRLPHKVGQTHQFWQEGSHPQQIQNASMMRQKLEYIHHNPVRRGYVDDPTHWRYSSARNYAGMPGLIDVVTDWY